MANKFVDLGNKQVQRNEAVAARRTLIYAVTTAEVSTTEVCSKAGGALTTVSTGAQAVLLDTICKFVIPVADIDTLGPLVYKLTGATDVVYITGIEVVEYDPYTEGAATEMAIRQRAGQPR